MVIHNVEERKFEHTPEYWVKLKEMDDAPHALAVKLWQRFTKNPQLLNISGATRELEDKAPRAVGLWEIRSKDKRWGVRFYYALRDELIILAGVGTKHTQKLDIKHACRSISEWDRRAAARELPDARGARGKHHR